MAKSLYWHDYETWGTDPSWDRAAQFAGIRTDLDLNIIGRSMMHYCKPADDMLPHPEACLITGITPQKAMKEGLCEAEFMAEIHRELSHPGTCGLGYNSLRFDDEVTRYGFYRNFFDPYGREWKNGNSRWDIIDMVRLTHALRPEGINWPQNDDGTTSFKLEALTQANGIEHDGAHDALSDVLATIELARLIKKQQPKLYQYLFDNRSKNSVRNMLNLRDKQVILHVSSMYPASLGCIAPVIPLIQHPVNQNGIVVYDLRNDPEHMLQLGPEGIRERLFVKKDELAEGVERIPLKTVHLNKCPVLSPMAAINPQEADRWQIDQLQAERYAKLIRNSQSLAKKIETVYKAQQFTAVDDPDCNLYGGGFFSDLDRMKMDDITDMNPRDLARTRMQFDDPRLDEMLFRYRARNWPQSLSKEERGRWDNYRKQRLSAHAANRGIGLAEYRRQLAEKVVQPDRNARERALLSELADWPALINLQ